MQQINFLKLNTLSSARQSPENESVINLSPQTVTDEHIYEQTRLLVLSLLFPLVTFSTRRDIESSYHPGRSRLVP
jgi:hypothetical protein